MLPEIFEKVNNRGLRGNYQARPVPYVPCPCCGSQIGEPCRGAQGYWLGTHSSRRSLLKHTLLAMKRTFKLLSYLKEAS